MAKRRRSGRHTNQQKLPKAAEIVGFTEQEEAFFSAGESIAEAHTAATEHEAEEQDQDRPGFWRRLFSKAA
jgi:hypothetical protein